MESVIVIFKTKAAPRPGTKKSPPKATTKLPKFTRTGRDLRPVSLTQRVRPVQTVKIAGNLLRTGQDLRPVRLTGWVRTGPTCPTLYPLESLALESVFAALAYFWMNEYEEELFLSFPCGID